MESEKNFAGAAVQRVTCLPVADAVFDLLFAEQIVNNIFKKLNVDLNGRDVHFVGSPIILPDNADFFVEDSSQIKLQRCINLSYVDEKTFYGREKLPSNLEFVIPRLEELKKIVNIAKKALSEENAKHESIGSFLGKIYAKQQENAKPESIDSFLGKIYAKQPLFIVYLGGPHRYAAYNSDNNTLVYSLNDYFYGYELRISRLPQKQDRLQYILEKELYPVLKNVELDIEYEALVNLVQQQLVQFKGGNLVVEAAKLAQVQSCLAKYKLWKNAPQPDCSKIKNLHLNVDELTGNLLVRDTVRADLTAYDKMQMEDPNRGSWELWDALHDETENKVEVGRYFYARDPRTDILEGGLVGIDFGTKSTVVAIKGDTETITPIRVGSGQLDAAVKAKHYENPTVMEFIDIESFMQAYASREGRPLTSWADITTSHTAFEDWNNIDKTENYFAFFGELKQWAGDSSRNIRIRDKKKKEILLPPYAELHEGDFDPIEIYAYYIGLYINNMHRGKIFMEYLLSFPVTYTLDVRKRILNSFQRGLRRSLPQAIVQDEQCMQKFHVEQGGVLACGVVVVRFLLDGMVYSASELNRSTGLPVLGALASDRTKKAGKLDAKLYQMEGRPDGSADAEMLCLMAQTIRSRAPEAKNILVTGDLPADQLEALAAALQATEPLRGQSVTAAESILKAAATVPHVVAADAIVLAADCTVTRTDAVREQNEKIVRLGKQILGCIVYE